ncbi:hypothetical protein [Leyella stercorea]|uniref:hypothetical protein n=1 Tax=Leyella stercorea TaxID=363265 RepID=UPI00402A19DA
MFSASAPTITSIRIDRREHPRRPSRASASTAASIRVDRREHLRRPPRTISIRLQK